MFPRIFPTRHSWSCASYSSSQRPHGQPGSYAWSAWQLPRQQGPAPPNIHYILETTDQQHVQVPGPSPDSHGQGSREFDGRKVCHLFHPTEEAGW